MKIAIVSGEQSGDELGAAVMQTLLKRNPEITFFGVGGPKMLGLGLRSLFSQERLAVMGFVEPFKRLPDLLAAKKTIVDTCIAEQPDLYLGIDSPDFNLRVEKPLRAAGIKTAHYVSPSVWAWRQGRIKGIRKSVDLMLTLFPFEKDFYDQHDVSAVCVGHPLADTLPIQEVSSEKKQQLKQSLNLSENFLDAPLVTIMPGSRGGEVRMMGELFLKTAQLCLQKNKNLHFLLPAANQDRKQQLELLLAEHPELTTKVKLLDGQSHEAMQLADVVLLASGTSSLEAMLLKRPMVVAYKLAKATYFIAKHLVKTPYISLPNLIANKKLIPEFIQDEASAENLAQAVLAQLNEQNAQQLKQQFSNLHEELQLNASEKAADALLDLMAARNN